MNKEEEIFEQNEDGDWVYTDKEWARLTGMTYSELREEASEHSKKYGLLKFLKDNPNN